MLTDDEELLFRGFFVRPVYVKPRSGINNTIADLLFYLIPWHCVLCCRFVVNGNVLNRYIEDSWRSALTINDRKRVMDPRNHSEQLLPLQLYCNKQHIFVVYPNTLD